MIEETLPKVTIIVNSYKNIDKLKKCLHEIRNVKYTNKEIIVVTHGINKKTINIKGLNSHINKLIILKEDYGPPAQRNIGFKSRDKLSKYVLFIDDDVILQKSTINNLVECLENNPDIGIVQPLLTTKNQLIDCAGAKIDFLGYTYIIFKNKSISSIYSNQHCFEVSYTSSACMLLRVSLYNEDKYFQPFDEHFYFNYEDADLCLRSWIKGKRVVCMPSTTAIHDRGRTSSLLQSPPNLVFLNTRNKFITLTSIYSLNILVFFIPLFFVFESIKAISLIRINLSHTLSIFKALFWCLKNLNQIYIRRKIISKTSNHIHLPQKIITTPIFISLIKAFKSHYQLNTKHGEKN